MVSGPSEHFLRALPAHQTLHMCGERVQIIYRNVFGAFLWPRNVTYVDPARFLLSRLVARLLSGPLVATKRYVRNDFCASGMLSRNVIKSNEIVHFSLPSVLDSASLASKHAWA